MALIHLEGLSLFGHHGATAIERRVGTRLGVDVVVDVASTRAETSDRLADTVSYDVIEAAARRIVEGESYRLLEALAARVAETLAALPRVETCTVRLTKQNLAWPTGGRVTVEVTRAARTAARRRTQGVRK
ncbi:MAG: dihydroneopterin aldolase [Candidatus Eisenbacteria bacterium]